MTVYTVLNCLYLAQRFKFCLGPKCLCMYFTWRGERKLSFYPCHKTLRIKLMPSFQPSFFITDDVLWWGHHSHLKKHCHMFRHKTWSGKSGVWQYEKLLICIFIAILSAFLVLSYCTKYWSYKYTRDLRYYSAPHRSTVIIQVYSSL